MDKIEYLDVVNDDDIVVGKALRKDIYENKHRHRIVHVLIFNDREELALALRSSKARYCPLHWVTSAGGHVQSGESYEEGALRELGEELGIKAELKFAFKDNFDNMDGRNLKKYLVTFTAAANGPFNINPDEAEKVKFFNIDKIKKMIKDGEKFHPELVFLLEKHY